MASAKRSARKGPASSLAPVCPASWMCTLGRSDSNGMFVLQDPTGLGNHSTIPWFVLYLIRNYSQLHSVPAWKMPCPSKAKKEGGPPEPQRKATTGQGLGIFGGYAQGHTIAVSWS